MDNDSFYTPLVLADRLIEFSKKNDLKTAADFCVGDGELLRSVQKRWPQIKCFGTDISADAINKTAIRHSRWVLDTLDFLNETDRNKSVILKKKRKFDLIVLNPPFSCKGGTTHQVTFNDRNYTVSTAMKFLVTSLSYLREDGVLYAILPTSVAYSQRDNAIWCELERKLNLSILEEPNIQYFKECAPNVILVSLNDLNQISNFRSIERISLDLKKLSVFRGKVSMNLVQSSKGEHYLIHSTNIKENKLVDLKVKQSENQSLISGPALLIPRVGKPNVTKICVITAQESYILSDCIIAIKTTSLKDAKILMSYLTDNWNSVQRMYQGTGAKYITIDKLEQFLNLDIEKGNFLEAKAI